MGVVDKILEFFTPGLTYDERDSHMSKGSSVYDGLIIDEGIVPDFYAYTNAGVEVEGVQRLFEGAAINLDVETFCIGDEERFNREIIKRGQVVAVMIVHSGNPGESHGSEHLILIEQFRAGPKQNILEIPAGVLEDGEDPFDRVRREALEEVGARLNKVKYVTSFYLSPGISDELCHLFFAKVSKKDMVEPMPDGVEERYSRIHYIARNNVRDAMGSFIDAKTQIAVGWWVASKVW